MIQNMFCIRKITRKKTLTIPRRGSRNKKKTHLCDAEMKLK